MIVCLCHGISDTKIREAIRTGAKTVNEVQRSCRAGTDCGSCVMVIEELVRQGAASPQTAAHTDKTNY